MFSGELYRCHREGFKEQDVSSREGAATPGEDHGRLVIPRTGRETVKRGDGSLVIGTRGTLLSPVLAYGIIWSEPECRAYVSFSGPGGRQLRTPEYVTPTIPVPLRFCCVVSLLPSRFDNTVHWSWRLSSQRSLYTLALIFPRFIFYFPSET
jgi:hypothetical protein